MRLPNDTSLLDFGNEIQLAGAIYAGKEKVFLFIFPDDDPPITQQWVDVLSNSDWEILLRQTDLLNVETGPAKAILRKSQRQIDSNLSWEVYRRDNYTCRYCGANTRPLTVDHIDLWENGGVTTAANLVSACRQCNKHRGRMLYPEWLTSPYYVSVARNLDDRTRMANLELLKSLPELEKLRVPLQKVRSR